MARRLISIHSLAVVVTALMVTAFAGSNLCAQVDTGTILGTIKDQSGAVIPNAKVSLTNEETNLTF